MILLTSIMLCFFHIIISIKCAFHNFHLRTTFLHSVTWSLRDLTFKGMPFLVLNTRIRQLRSIDSKYGFVRLLFIELRVYLQYSIFFLLLFLCTATPNNCQEMDMLSGFTCQDNNVLEEYIINKYHVTNYSLRWRPM